MCEVVAFQMGCMQEQQLWPNMSEDLHSDSNVKEQN